jgi:hypothetical protein
MNDMLGPITNIEEGGMSMSLSHLCSSIEY